MNSKIIPIKFRDLINELAYLCKMDNKNDVIGFYVTTSVCYYGRYNLEEMIELMNDKNFNFRYGNDYLYVILYGKKNNKYIFFYNFKLKLDYNELQADGKILKDYFKVKSDGDYFSYSLINIDNNVDNLILYFDDNVLNMENRTDFYPNILLKDAVDNCCLKNNMKKVRIKR